jgi:acyl-CoA synthetase (AMP-forming)/AMP-acid ligase II
VSIARTIAQLAQQFSANIVVQETDGRKYTYAELIEHYSTFARGLSRIAKESNFDVGGLQVATIFDNSIEMYAALLAVLSIGGVCVPIDASHTPTNRILFMVEDSGANVLVVYDKPNKNCVSCLRL